MKSRLPILIISPILWFIFLCSISFAMLHWRVTNEPGAKAIPLLANMATLTFLLGFGGTIVSQIVLFKKPGKELRRVWVLNMIASVLYIPLFLLTLLLMV